MLIRAPLCVPAMGCACGHSVGLELISNAHPPDRLDLSLSNFLPSCFPYAEALGL